MFSAVLRGWNQSDFNLVFPHPAGFLPQNLFGSDWGTEKKDIIQKKKKNLIIIPIGFYLLMQRCLVLFYFFKEEIKFFFFVYRQHDWRLERWLRN